MISPESAFSSKHKHRASVDFPEPDCPINPKMVPAGIERSAESTARFSACFLLKSPRVSYHLFKFRTVSRVLSREKEAESFSCDLGTQAEGLAPTTPSAICSA